MARYKLRPSLVEATQWFKNGDHPEDNSEELDGSDGPFLSEGHVVRRYRHPTIDGQTKCSKCENIYHNHGWIDMMAEDKGITICPGDWVILKHNGFYFSLDDGDFNIRYEK